MCAFGNWEQVFIKLVCFFAPDINPRWLNDEKHDLPKSEIGRAGPWNNMQKNELKFCWLDQENLSCQPFLSHFAVSCWVAISQVQISLSGLIKDHDLIALLVSPVLVVLLVFSISVFNEFWYIQYKIYWALQKYAWTSGKDKPKNWFNFPGHVMLV